MFGGYGPVWALYRSDMGLYETFRHIIRYLVVSWCLVYLTFHAGIQFRLIYPRHKTRLDLPFMPGSGLGEAGDRATLRYGRVLGARFLLE